MDEGLGDLTSIPLRRLVTCLDGRRVPVSAEERSHRPGNVPYWGANGIVGSIDQALFNEPLVLLGEDGAPFFDRSKDIAFFVAGPVWVNNHIHVLRPDHVEPRFLTHALNGTDFGAVISGSTRDKLTQEDMHSIRIPDHSATAQRRIADFLDDRVARIDKVIAARREQCSRATGLRWAGFEEAVRSAHPLPVPLRRALSFIADGPFGSAFSSADYIDEGPAVIRLGNIGFAEFVSRDIARIPEEIYGSFPRCHVGTGDLLIAGLGDASNHAGRACLAPPFIGPAMVKGKCYVARPAKQVADPEFLSLLLSSPAGARALSRQGTGATRNMLNLDRLLSCLLPIPDIETQHAIVREHAEWRAECTRASDAFERSVALLTEYKHSLITAAVTGELDVTAASKALPE